MNLVITQTDTQLRVVVALPGTLGKPMPNTIAALDALFVLWMASLPIDPPAPGSGIRWNNAGVPCIA
jgi:hypothetical protein